MGHVTPSVATPHDAGSVRAPARLTVAWLTVEPDAV